MIWLFRRIRRWLTGVVLVVALLAVLGIVLAPIAVRALIVDYLDAAGVTATVGHVGVNWWTGTLTVDDAQGSGAQGDAFRVGRLSISLRYAPLLSQRVVFHRIRLANAVLDLRRGRDGTLAVAGVPLDTRAKGQRAAAAADWSLGVDRLHVTNLRLNYRSPAFAKTLTVKDVSADDIRAGQTGSAVPIKADVRVAGGRVDLIGKARLFGSAIRTTLHATTRGIALDYGNALIADYSMPTLAGRLDSDLDIRARYDTQHRRPQESGLDLHASGRLDWRNAGLAGDDLPKLAADRLRWKGQFDLSRPGNRGNSDNSDNSGEPGSITLQGRAQADALALTRAGVVRLSQAASDWQGRTRITLRKGAPRISNEGTLTADSLSFGLTDRAAIRAARLRWKGRVVIDAARRPSRYGDGTLTLGDTALSLAPTPLAIRASRLVFDGRFGQEPGTVRESPVARVNASLNAENLAAINTRIHADWLTADRLRIRRLQMSGPAAIGFKTLHAEHLRVLTDTNTPASVLEATTASANQFRLDDLRAYRLAWLNLAGATIHLRRDAGGLGVISEYLGGRLPAKPAPTTPAAAIDPPSPAGPTFAVQHLAISGPSIAFTDVVADPVVRLRGSNMSLKIDGFDSARPEHKIDYRLALDVGAYGHLDSRGKIAPMAPGGLDLLGDAWLRSLATAPLSGYLNAAMGRRIANGAADGTLHLQAVNGTLNGMLDATLANFRLAATQHKKRTIALGISVDSALALVRGQNDVIHFKTAILGDVENPYFSIRNLIREAVLAGLRTTLLSDYSPLGVLNKARTALLGLVRSLASRPVRFVAGKHYIRPVDRGYLGHLARTLRKQPGIRLRVTGRAAPADADALARDNTDGIKSLAQLARLRAQAVRDYLAARDVSPDHIRIARPVVDQGAEARPQVTFGVIKDR